MTESYSKPGESEIDYRKKAEDLLNFYEGLFERLPELAVDLERIPGVLTITFPDQTRGILSLQPALSQVWLALEAQALGLHFSYDAASQSWKEGGGQELMAFLENFCQHQYGMGLH